MSFYKYQALQTLNDCTEQWNIRVRAQFIWKGVNAQTGEFRGYNILFVDDSVRTKCFLLQLLLYFIFHFTTSH